ncbi:hypothetical protein HY624_03715 [Candidatus Uhrbacteria bacterium]|nr:hypothetical protein [Candidatus Uhrbacteria bacterium]
MKIVRISFVALLISAIGFIPPPISRADSHIPENGMSPQECADENYKRFEECMDPCMGNEANYEIARNKYGEPTTFEGTDLVFRYCSQACFARKNRIDCENIQGTNNDCEEQKKNQEEINQLWREYYTQPDANPLRAKLGQEERLMNRSARDLAVMKIDKQELQKTIDLLREEIKRLEDLQKEILDKIYGRAPRVLKKNCPPSDTTNNEERATEKTGDLIVNKVGENVTILSLHNPSVVTVKKGSLVAKQDVKMTANEPQQYSPPRSMEDVTAALHNARSIEEAHEYMQLSEPYFPHEQNRVELLDLKDYFEILYRNLDNAKFTLRRAVENKVSKLEIESIIQKSNAGVLSMTDRNESREKIRDAFRENINFAKELEDYLDKLRTPDPATALTGAAAGTK